MREFKALRDFQWFADLSDDDCATLQSKCQKRSFNPGQLVLHDQDRSFDVYFVLKGSLYAAYGTDDGREVLFSRMAQGRAFGELSAIDGQPRSLSVYVASDGPTEVMVMPHTVFLDMLKEHPSVAHNVMISLVKYVRDISERFSQVTTLSVKQRVCAQIARLALEQGVFRDGAELNDMPTHAELGNSIGANREAVSRAISALNAKGVIKTQRRRVVLINPQDLLSE